MNISKHKNIRKYILNNGSIKRIIFFDNLFSNVVTDCIAIDIENNKAQNKYINITQNTNKQKINIDNFYNKPNYFFRIYNEFDSHIIHIIKKKSRYFLDKSKWGLGVVTGNNKNKLKTSNLPFLEPIYTGKEINKFTLNEPKYFIEPKTKSFQQIAPLQLYRANKKLVYKFISKKLIFAIDKSKSLFLNSANILLPNIPNMSIESVCAFLNSNVFSFLYIKMFNDVKVLKNNLLELPFPLLTPTQNYNLTNLVNKYCNNNIKISDIDNFIYSFYKLSSKDIEYIEKNI